MPEKTLIVHDCRAAGVLGAAVLTRLMQRNGYAVEVWYDKHLTGRTAKFWTEGIAHLLQVPRSDTDLVLFGITFHDLDPKACMRQLALLRRCFRTVDIWTHRYPDGYRKHNLAVYIPPDDLIYNDPANHKLAKIGLHLDGYDKHLLATSLVASKAVPPASFPEADELFQTVARSLDANLDATWKALVEGTFTGGVQGEEISQSALKVLQSPAEARNVAEVEISKENSRYIVPILDEFCKQAENVDNSTVVVCWIADERVAIYRQDRTLTRPALRWLMEHRFREMVPDELKDRHFGGQDFVQFSLPASGEIAKPSLRDPMMMLATKLSCEESGGRNLTAALTRDVAWVGNEILRGIDLAGSYTSGKVPKIQIKEDQIYVLVHRSSRTGALRATLTVPIEVTGSEATAFLFRDNGYNLLKAEHAVEGALIGLNLRRLTWLHPKDPETLNTYLPNRVRLDVRPKLLPRQTSKTFAQATVSLLAQGVTALDKARGGVHDDSVIGRFLANRNLDKLVCYNETETIGPSVAHALVLLAAAKCRPKLRVAEGQNGTDSGVLDLFSGSGVANRLLTENNIPITSVDWYVSAQDVGLQSGRGGLWLRADARQVLDAEAPILEQRFSVIAMDPPHAELMDLLFSTKGKRSLAAACAERSHVLVLYQGHSTQAGRLGLLESGLLGAGWPLMTVIHVEEELIVVAAHSAEEVHFDTFVSDIMREVQHAIETEGLGVLTVRRLVRPW